MLRPAFGFAAVFANLPVAAALFARDESWSVRVRLAVVPLALGAVALFLPEHRLAERDRSATVMMSAARVAIHADLVRAQIADDLARPEGPPRYERAWLQGFQARMDHSFAASAEPTRRWPALGFNPDYMLAIEPFWYGSFPSDRASDRAVADFCNYYYFRTWEHRPVAMLTKIGRELGIFYHFDYRQLRLRKLAATADPYSQQEQVQLTAPPYYPRTARSLDVPSLRERMDRSDAFRRYLATCQRPGRSKTLPRVYQAKAVGVLNNLVHATYLPVLVLALTVALAIALRPAWRPRAGLAAATIPLLYAYNFGMCLTVAIVQTLGTARYVENQAVFTLFAWWGGCSLLGACLAAGRAPHPLRAGENVQRALLHQGEKPQHWVE